MKNWEYVDIIKDNPRFQKDLCKKTNNQLKNYSLFTKGIHDIRTKNFLESVLEPISKDFSLKLFVDKGKKLGGTYPDLWQSKLGDDEDVDNVNNRNIDNVDSNDSNYDPTISVIIIIIFFQMN